MILEYSAVHDKVNSCFKANFLISIHGGCIKLIIGGKLLKGSTNQAQFHPCSSIRLGAASVQSLKVKFSTTASEAVRGRWYGHI